MNISSSALIEAAERDGSPAEDRSDRVEQALEMQRKVGWRDGKPMVPSPGGECEGLQLGDSFGEAYGHYVRGADLLLPSAQWFVSELAEVCDSLEDMAEEVNSDKATVRRALDLHGVDDPEPSEDDSEATAGIRLPSGEVVPTELLADPPQEDKLLLAQLLSDGMGVAEIARYLSRETGDRVTESDVREACRDASLIGAPVPEQVEEVRTSGHEVSIPPQREIEPSDKHA